MIAEILYELKNIHIIGQRVLDTENAKVETTITASGNFRGIPYRNNYILDNANKK